MAMTFTETVNTLATSTFADVSKKLKNSVFEVTPFLTYMNSKGRIKARDGSREIRLPIIVDDTDNSTWFNEDGDVSVEGVDPNRYSRWQWKYVATPVKQVYTQIHKNSSQFAILNMITDAIEHARMSLSANFETILNGDGTTDDAPEGLQSLISTSPTSSDTIGGWDQASYSWWQNKTKAASGTSADEYLQDSLRDLDWDCSAYGPRPDLHVCDGNLYKRYRRIVEGKQLYIDRDMADLGWPDTITYNHKPVVASRKAQEDTWRMLNSEDITLFRDPAKWFSLGPWKQEAANMNQVAHLVCACGFCAHRRVTSGVLTGITAD